MKKHYFFLVIIGVMFFSCKRVTKEGELMTILVDIDQNVSLPLSTITVEITAIELELTDQSVINPDRIIRVLLTDNNVILAEREKILVFNNKGDYLLSIGNRGQGPGEYMGVRNLAVDKKNRFLYVSTGSKLICYDLNGNFIKESSIVPNQSIKDLNYINNKLLIVVEHIGRQDSKGLFQHSVIYTLDNDMQIVDSCVIRNTYFKKTASFINPYENFILFGNETIFAYYPDIYFNEQIPLEVVLRDTLYNYKNNRLTPELKLKFKNDGIDGNGNKFIHLYNIYRSSQYVFAFYHNSNNKCDFHFIHDLKTGNGYNMRDGYIDDIDKIEQRKKIRPLNFNSEIFYYWHTHMNEGDLEEPNPTLYIGTLKK